MDPTRLTLISAAGGVLLAALVLGPVFIVSLVNYDGEDGSGLQEGSMSRPAAQEAFAKGLHAEDAAYLEDRFEMTMEVIGDDQVLLGEAVVRADPQEGDFQFIAAVDLKAIEEAYGSDEADTTDDTVDQSMDLEGDTGMFGALFPDLEEEEWERFELYFASIGELHALSFAPGTGIAWRDFTPKEPLTLFDEDTEDAFPEEEAGFDPDFGGEELGRFIDANESIAVHKVEGSEWEGTPAWKVTTTIQGEGFEEEGVFHFRQSDMAPLAFDLHMDGASENGFFSMLGEEEQQVDLEALKDVQIHMKMRFRYGDSVQFDPPQLKDYARIPAAPETEDEWETDRIVRTLTEAHEQPVPLDSLEIHLVVQDDRPQEDFFGAPIVSDTLGVLRLKDAHEVETEDHRIVYEDNDGDGRLSSGDRFFVETSDEEGIWWNSTHSVQLLVYDTWAEEYEGAPAPAVFWLVVLALAGGGLLRHRRRHQDPKAALRTY